MSRRAILTKRQNVESLIAGVSRPYGSPSPRSHESDVISKIPHYRRPVIRFHVPFSVAKLTVRSLLHDGFIVEFQKVSGVGGSAVSVKVLLSHNYTLANPRPVGFPTKPGLTGAANPEYPGEVLAAGTTVTFQKPEADALVTAGAGSYA